MSNLTPDEREENCRIALGTVPKSEYRLASDKSIEALESAVKEWLATGPGHYSAASVATVYEQPLADFIAYSGEEETALNNFEIALNRLGFRAGVVIHKRREVWLLMLTKKRAS